MNPNTAKAGERALDTAIFMAKLTRELTPHERDILFACLPPERQARFLRAKSPAGQAEILCAYGLLRVALRLKCGWRTLPAVALSDSGKPYFPDYPGVRFNLSHTDGAVIAGVSDGPIGVDIEKARPMRPRLTRRVAGTDDLETFFRVWVAAEAVGKRDGRGVWPVLRDGVPPLSDAAYRPLDAWPGYFAACALYTPRVPVETRLYIV